ncbi:MAG TPA: DUF805 domain-containing protein [Saprospiraceae bacterium]|nr:DUF805 domain-containing protein [Saprospiraceae bacterium]
MTQTNNIYKYEPPKSTYQEEGLFSIKGRITLNQFLKRCLPTGIILLLLSYIYFYYVLNYQYHVFIILIFLAVFIVSFIFSAIQSVKRLHDVNKSGWFFLIPLYNIYLLFSKGCVGVNNYGIDPRPIGNVKYYDELGPDKINSSKDIKNESQNKDQKIFDFKSKIHQFIKDYRDLLSNEEILEEFDITIFEILNKISINQRFSEFTITYNNSSFIEKYLLGASKAKFSITSKLVQIPNSGNSYIEEYNKVLKEFFPKYIEKYGED